MKEAGILAAASTRMHVVIYIDHRQVRVGNFQLYFVLLTGSFLVQYCVPVLFANDFQYVFATSGLCARCSTLYILDSLFGYVRGFF